MTDPFVGRWRNLVCVGPPDIEEALAGATLDISAANEVTWKLAGVPVSSTGTLEGTKLWGEVRAGDLHCYYEIAARTPPPSLLAPRRCIYGIVSRIRGHGNGDLGDPGTWTAEESGPGSES